MIRGGRLSTVQGKQTLEAKQSTVNRKQLTALILSSVLLISFVAITIATGFFGINTTKISSLEKGLVAHYPLDGIHQTKDITPYGNHGTNHGATLTTGVKDEPEGAYSFDGVNGHIEMNSYSHTSGNGTISLWVKTSSNSNQIIIGSYNGLAIGIYDKDKLIGTSQQLGRKPLGVMGESFELNKWQHLVVTLNEGNIKYYLDGNLLPTTSDNLWSWGTNVAIIGRRSSGETNLYHFNGSLSDVRIYNRALSEDEIQLLFDSYKPTASTSDLNKGLVGHWMLDAENGAKDLTPYGNHGTAQGGVIIGGVEDRKGKSNGATSFDGVDDFILTEKVVNETNPSEFTIHTKFYLKGVRSSYDGIISLLGTSDTSVSGGITLNVVSTNTLRVRHWNDGGTNYVFVVSDLLNNWHDVSIVINNKNIKIYVDAELKTDENFVNDFNINDGRFTIGSYPGQQALFNGSIFDVRYYNRALSTDEIKLLYDQYKPKEASVGSLQKGLVLDMPLTTKHMKSATVVSDRTPYGNDGTVNGATVGSEYTSFDGVDDWIEVVDSDILELEDYFTVSVWIKPKIQSDNKVIFYKTDGLRRISIAENWGSTNIKPLYAVYLIDDMNQRFWTGEEINTNEWNHYVVILNGKKQNGLTVYHNGVQSLYSTAGFRDTTNMSLINPKTNIFIGTRGLMPERYFDGDVSNLKIWNRALSAEEVKLLYEKGRY